MANYGKAKIMATDIDSKGRFVFRVARADAPLFKATPLMYEALKELAELREMAKLYEGDYEAIIGGRSIDEFIALTIEVALAKAESRRR